MGAPIIFGDKNNPICLIHPLTVKDKCILGKDYNKILGLLTIDQEDIDEILMEHYSRGEMESLEKITPLEYLMINADYNDTFLLEFKQALSTFIKDDIMIIPKAQEIILGNINDNKKIDASNFSDFQKIIRLENHMELPEEIPEDEDPMARKFRLRRKALKEAKNKQAAKDDDAPEFVDLMSGLCCANVGITWNNIKDLPIFTFYELLSRSQRKEKYDIDIQSLLAGADSKKIKPKYWMSKNSD